MNNSKDPKYQVVASAVRVEVDNTTDDIYLVFKIVNEQFKQKIRGNWQDDVELLLVEKDSISIK